MKRHNGEFIGNYAPYGYRKSPEDRHRLEIDDEAAQTIRSIFDWYTDGLSASAIVKRLNSLHVLSPSAYKTANGCRGFQTHSSGGAKTGVWAISSVNTMLRDEVYIGNLVQAKYKSVSYRSKKMAPNDKDRWTVIEHAHEAIISDEQFAAVHDRLALHPRVSRQKGIAHFLSGLVFCGSCGRRMTRCTSGGHARWRCPTRTYAPDKCQCPSFSEKSLCEIVLEEVQKQVAGLVDARDAIESARKGQRGVSAANEYELALTRAEREKVRLKDAKFQLYDSLQSGVIDQAEYRQFKAQYQEKVAEQDRQITMLHTDLDALKAARKSDDEFVKFFSDCGNIQTLDRAVVSQLIDRIVILDAFHVEIYFKFSGASNKISGFAKKTKENQTSTCG